MSNKPVKVEVLDVDGRPVGKKGALVRAQKRPSILSASLNAAIFMCAMVAAFGILLVGIGQVLQERARGGAKKK